MSTNWSNTWKHACYCAFMFTFTAEHVCFHVISVFIVLTFDPTGKGSITGTVFATEYTCFYCDELTY